MEAYEASEAAGVDVAACLTLAQFVHSAVNVLSIVSIVSIVSIDKTRLRFGIEKKKE